MHDIGVVVAGEDIAGAAHIGGKLVDFIEPPIDRHAAEILLPEVADDKIVSLAVAKFGKFEIDAADPKTLALQTADDMAADESAGSANQG